MRKPATRFAVVLTLLMIGAGCGGSDGATGESAQSSSDPVEANPQDDSTGSETATDSSDDETTAAFGDLIEGTFLLSGAAEQQYYVSDDQLAFRTGGGCSGGAFGSSVNITDAAAQTTFATFGAQMQQDLSGGVIGEFDAVDAEITLFPGGDMSLAETYAGPVRMIISEHDTGGVDADLNARRMTVTLLGVIPSENGDLDVDVTYRWVMGCP